MSRLTGDWVGVARPEIGAWVVKLRITEDSGSLKAIAYTYGEPAEHSVAEFRGERDEGQESGTLWIVDFAQDDPSGTNTFAGLLALVYETGDRLRATYHNDVIGSDYSFFLLRSPKRFWPLRFNKAYRTWLRINQWFLRRMKHFYLVFILVVTLSPIWNVGGVQLNAWNTIVLIAPLLILFRNSILQFIQALRLKKVGSVEFQEQPTRQEMSKSLEQVQQELLSRFGEEKLSKFVALSRYFVPRTKWLLERMHRRNAAQTRRALEELAVLVGIPMENFDTTINVLVESQVITISDDGRYVVTTLGQSFLVYEEMTRSL